MTTLPPPADVSLQEPGALPQAARLLPGDGCWWIIHGPYVARLPETAVRETGSGQQLVAEAYQQLTEAGFFTTAPTTAYAVTVLTATACNLGCAYCFQNTALPEPGSFAPPRIRAASLTPELIQQISRFVSGQMQRYDLPQTSLLVFGGEPLMNVDGTRGLLRAMGDLGLADAEIITNGVLLRPPLARQLADDGLRRMQITFDGARDDHDGIRVTRNGRGTYDTILRNVTAAADVSELSWNFRINISHRNLDGIDRLIDDIAAAAPVERTSLHLALIDDVGLGYDNTVTYSARHAEQFIALNARAIDSGMTVPVSQPLSTCPYCSAPGGKRGAVINADGALYSCWETVGREAWVVGSITEGYLSPEVVDPRWVACDYDTQAHGTPQQARDFFDRIDSAALDTQYAARGTVTAH